MHGTYSCTGSALYVEPPHVQQHVARNTGFKKYIFKVKWTKFIPITCLSNVVDQVQKKPDKFGEELLSDGTEENDTGFWKSLTRYSLVLSSVLGAT